MVDTRRPLRGAAIRVRGLTKSFPDLGGPVTALDDVSLDIPEGSMVALVGVGKTALLRLLAARERPDRGSIEVDGVDITALDADGLVEYRLGIGFVGQDRVHTLPPAVPFVPRVLDVGQRRAVARALAGRAGLLLADEPTGGESADLLRGIRAEYGTTVVVATRDPGVTDRCDRVIGLAGGRVVADLPAQSWARRGDPDGTTPTGVVRR